MACGGWGWGCGAGYSLLHPACLGPQGDDEYSHIIHPIQSLDSGRVGDGPTLFRPARV